MNKLPTSKQRHKSNVCSRGRSRGCSSTFVKTCVSSQSTLIYIAKSRVNRYTVKTVNTPPFFFFRSLPWFFFDVCFFSVLYK